MPMRVIMRNSVHVVMRMPMSMRKLWGVYYAALLFDVATI